MTDKAPAKPVERLFPFVLRSRILLVGRETLSHSKRHLHFVLLTTDLSESSRQRILADFAHYPVLQHYTSSQLEEFFSIRGAKVIGFAKSTLAQSIYSELKAYRLNQPIVSSRALKGLPSQGAPAESAPPTEPAAPAEPAASAEPEAAAQPAAPEPEPGQPS